MVELIKKKRNGGTLSKEELKEIVDGFVGEKIPDYQVAAFLMAVFFKGMNPEETANFTELMMHSGELIDLSAIKGIKVDKHSTGGVGDKTTLILAPLVAAAGIPVAKMSGRGLGHTGGTLDKMESIEGLNVEMSKEQFLENIQDIGIAVCGQNANLVPADKKLYALRDVTGTVNQFSLIASSIMSKKLACGADAIVIDIKVGNGAFMTDVAEATVLGNTMKAIAQNMNREITCVLTAMEQPLGRAVGNALEVKEAIDTLKGQGPEDLTELCYHLGGQMLVLAKKANNLESAKEILKELIDSGKALKKFKELVTKQGGNVQMIEQPELLPDAKIAIEVQSWTNGYVNELKALDIGLASMKLGAGRETKKSVIDMGAGVYLHKKVGEKVEKGETLATLYTNKEENIEEATKLLVGAYKIDSIKPEDKDLILKVIN